MCDSRACYALDDIQTYGTESPFYTYAQFCSPCVPGAGNLNSPFEPAEQQKSNEEIEIVAKAMGFPKVLCLGSDWFENGNAPYPIFNVKA